MASLQFRNAGYIIAFSIALDNNAKFSRHAYPFDYSSIISLQELALIAVVAGRIGTIIVVLIVARIWPEMG
jgi:hypothetical protein